MANTRSGGAPKDGTGDTGAVSASTRKAASAAAKAKDFKSMAASSSAAVAGETSSSSARESKDGETPTTTTTLRRSNRETKGKKPSVTTNSQSSARGGGSSSSSIGGREATRKPSPRKLKGLAEITGEPSTTRKSSRVKSNGISACSVSKHANGNPGPVATPKKITKRQTDEQNSLKKHDGAQSGSRPLKKQKRLDTKSSTEEKAKSPVLPTPLRMGEEDASKGAFEDNDSVSGYEVSDAEENNQEHISEGVNKLLEGHSSDQAVSISETHMPIDICSQNTAAESNHAMEAGEQTTGNSNQIFVPELPNRPCSNVDLKEAIKDGDLIGMEGACNLRQTEFTKYVEANCDDFICTICESKETAGILKSCDGKGCKRHYHLSCLYPPLECDLGIWLCSTCIKKKLQFGVYSVTGEVESLWDATGGIGVSKRKQYFVKYKNLAHVHNRWVPESDIIFSPGGHDLVSKFNKRIQKDKTIRWKKEWAEPHRLLKKRPLMSPKEAEEFFSSLGDKFAYCNIEWLVKWKDLGYEHATWELDSSSFLCTPEAKELKMNYDSRHEAARKAFDSAKMNKVKNDPFQKLHRLPEGCPPGLDGDHLSLLNQLREFWHNSGGAILVDDQERVIKTILFVMSIIRDVFRPLLIVSSSASLSVWEAKFNRLAPSINVVVYSGNKDVRRSVQQLEFYDNGAVVLQVLLSHPDAILEDIEIMECIGWEAVIIDDCQNSRVSKCLEELKHLSTDFRMVLLGSPIKESIAEYINLLSFLNSEGQNIFSISDGDSTDTASSLAMLKAKLTRYIAYGRKVDSSKFLEYWLPARLSRVQLEMYCHTLLSNSSAVRSHLKTDNFGVLRDILVSIRKCCDHPYLVDPSLQKALTKDCSVNILDIGVHASGKLLLLDKMLQEIRNRGLRVLVLSQSGGGAVNPMGDILDDFFGQRFGYESYERVERGLLVPKKQAAMNMFNDKSKGRFIFLIDSRACAPSIKLSSVDAIIIYSSDWNPANDLRALQKISIESQSDQVPIFRMYSSCTVEEKALILAKNEHVLDSNIQNIMPILSHSLLSWGANFLFNRLETKNQNDSSKDYDDDELFVDNVFSEFLMKLSGKVEASTKMNNVAISHAHLSGPFYSRDIVVVGEKEGITSVDGDLPKFWIFWSSLLDGRSPHWQHISEPAQRSRRKIQNMEEQVKLPTEEADGARTKRRKFGETMYSSPEVLAAKTKDSVLPENNTPSSSHEISVDNTWQELGMENLQGTQKGLYVLLKPELSKLYKLLDLPESAKCLCDEFLEYILKNHQFSLEPKSILHAFNIALCWRAASLLKHKVNHRESLVLAIKHLNYECNEELAQLVYEKLRIVKKEFSHRAGELSKQDQLASEKNISPYQLETTTKSKSGESIPNQLTSVDDEQENISHQGVQHDFWTETTVSRENELLSVPETHRDQHVLRDNLLNGITEKRNKLVDMVFSLREKNIRDKQASEVKMLDNHKKKVVMKLRETCNLVVKYLRRSHVDSEDKDEKIKLMIEWFTVLLYAYLEHMTCQHSKLEMQQSIVWSKEQQLKEKAFKEAKSSQLNHTFDQHIPLPDSNFVLEEFSHFREKITNYLDSVTLANFQQSLDHSSVLEIRTVIPSEVSNAEAARNGSAELHVNTEGRPASEATGLSENRSHTSLDGIHSRGASLAVQHSSSSASAVDSSLNQETTSGDHRRTEHAEDESAVGLQPFQGATGQHVGHVAMEVNGNNSEIITDPPYLEPPTVDALPRLSSSPTSSQVDTQTNLVIQSAQPSVEPAQVLQGEAEQVVLSGIASPQPLQPETQASTSGSHASLERTLHDRSQPSQQPEVASGPAQLFPVASMMFNQLIVGDDPLKNELHNLKSKIDSHRKMHEMKQSQLRTECSQDIEKIKKKYDLLLKEQDFTHLQQRKALDDLYQKVLLNQSLAEDFRAKFISTSAAQARAHSPPIRPPICQSPQASRQISMRLPSVVGSAAIPSSLNGRPPVPRHRVQPSQVDLPSSSSQVSHSSSPSSQVILPGTSIPGNRPSSSPLQVPHSSFWSSQVIRPPPSVLGNLVRSTSAPFSRMPPPHGSYGIQNELARAPAPHLQFKLPRAHSMAPNNQQQPPSIPEATHAVSPAISTSTSSQSFLSAISATLNSQSVLPDSLPLGSHPAATSLPLSIHTVLPAISLPPSSHPILPTTSVPSSSHPVPTTASIPSSSGQVLPTVSLPSSSHPVLLATSLSANSHPLLPASLVPSDLHPINQVPAQTSTPNPAAQATAPPCLLNTVPCISTAAPSFAGDPSTSDMEPGSESASLELDAWLTSNLGLSSDTPGTAAHTDSDVVVLCLSDDDDESE